MSKVRNLRAAVWNTLFNHAFTFDPRRKQPTEKMLTKPEVYAAIANLHVKLMPTDNPDLKYWQGFADAQLKITEAIEKL